MRWASLAIFFLDLGLGEVLLWGRLEPAFGGNRLNVFSGWTVQPKGSVHWHWSDLIRCIHAFISIAHLIHCTRALEWTDTSPPPPPLPQPQRTTPQTQTQTQTTTHTNM